METKQTLHKRACDYERKLYGLLIEHNTPHEEAVAVAHQAGEAYAAGLFKGYGLGLRDAREIVREQAQVLPFPEIGDWVLVRNGGNGSKWRLIRYKKTITRKDGTLRHLSETGKQYKFILPYKGNEHLIDTTTEKGAKQ